LLRIDDTDQQRNVEEALAPILHGLKWLGLDWDEGPDGKGGDFGPYGPYYQSRRQDKYQAAVDALLAAGAAYRDFAKPVELQAERDEAQKAGRPFTYSRRWCAETTADAARFEAEGRQGVVRLLMPREGMLVLDDIVRGRVEFLWANEQDHVIQRADGSCLYHLATVVDDHEMQISHVIRAEEHLSNTPRQVFIFQALGYVLPQFAHLPYVAEPGSKTKLSKRKLSKYLKDPEFRTFYDHGLEVAAVLDQQMENFVSTRGLENWNAEDRRIVADEFRRRLPINIPMLGTNQQEQAEIESILRNRTLDFFEHRAAVELYRQGTASLNAFGIDRNEHTFNPVIINFYEELGFLPDAILNYLLLLGWSLDDKTEEFSRRDMIRLFSLDRVNKSPASFDAKKLLAFQSRAMQRLSPGDRTDLVLSYLKRAGWNVGEFASYFSRIIELAGDRIKTAGDVVDYMYFFTRDHGFPYEPKALEKHIKGIYNVESILMAARQGLETVDPFTADRLENWMHELARANDLKVNYFVQPVRVAVTGKAVGFGLFDTLAILGREQCLARIDRALALAKQPS
jgi:glutamyl/glutaminyl-tRNA synthetase